MIGRDFERFREGRGYGRFRGLCEASLFDSGFQALALYRLGSWLRGARVPLLPACLRRLGIALCGIDILPQARIGPGLVIAHGIGLVIGGASVVGRDCTLLQGVTLGEARLDEDRCPTLGDRVVVGAGAKLLGGIAIGDDAVIGANAVVLGDVPAGKLAVGVPARVVTPAGGRRPPSTLA